VLYEESSTEIAALKKKLGKATNNVAEYEGLILGLGEALERGANRVSIRADSEVLVRQIKGEYRVRAAHLRPLHERATAMLGRFQERNLEHVRREQNARADALANEAIDDPGPAAT
jgi:ribonuclease HI